MKIYLPTYTNKKEVAEIETENARIEKWPSQFVAIYKGTIYNADHIYKTSSGAWADWDRDYRTMNKEAVDVMQFI